MRMRIIHSSSSRIRWTMGRGLVNWQLNRLTLSSIHAVWCPNWQTMEGWRLAMTVINKFKMMVITQWPSYPLRNQDLIRIRTKMIKVYRLQQACHLIVCSLNYLTIEWKKSKVWSEISPKSLTKLKPITNTFLRNSVSHRIGSVPSKRCSCLLCKSSPTCLAWIWTNFRVTVWRHCSKENKSKSYSLTNKFPHLKLNLRQVLLWEILPISPNRLKKSKTQSLRTFQRF